MRWSAGAVTGFALLSAAHRTRTAFTARADKPATRRENAVGICTLWRIRCPTAPNTYGRPRLRRKPALTPIIPDVSSARQSPRLLAPRRLAIGQGLSPFVGEHLLPTVGVAEWLELEPEFRHGSRCDSHLHEARSAGSGIDLEVSLKPTPRFGSSNGMAPWVCKRHQIGPGGNFTEQHAVKRYLEHTGCADELIRTYDVDRGTPGCGHEALRIRIGIRICHGHDGASGRSCGEQRQQEYGDNGRPSHGVAPFVLVHPRGTAQRPNSGQSCPGGLTSRVSPASAKAGATGAHAAGVADKLDGCKR